LQASEPQARKFVIEFTGGPLTDMPQRFDLSAVTTVSRGSVANASVLKILGTDRWRAEFDLAFAGQEPVDMRCFLRLGSTALSETWLYQHLPGNDGLQAR
jgi:glucans biosynthesis protein